MPRRPSAGRDLPDQTPREPWEGYTPDERARLREENAQLRARITRMQAMLEGLGAENERLKQAGGGSVERVQRVRSMLRERGSRNP